MAALAAEREVPVILMHMRGTPATMQDNPEYTDPVEEIKTELLNTAVLGMMGEWRPEEYLLLIGLSRKSFLGSIIDAEAKRSDDYFHQHVRSGDSAGNEPPISGTASRPGDRLAATIAAHAWCLGQGVDILRVHDVRETRQLIAVWEALSWTS